MTSHEWTGLLIWLVLFSPVWAKWLRPKPRVSGASPSTKAKPKRQTGSAWEQDEPMAELFDTMDEEDL